ncbi:MAG: DEAD/DEAH box helicase [Candidatus Manganitrophaceae bacterium]
MPLTSFHPIIADWFKERFGAPTEPQRLGWPYILAGEDTLIAAPTGSGKTLAAFLCAIDRLIRNGIAGRLENSVKVVYVSPLKALSSDVQRNLQTPLGEIQTRAALQEIKLPEIRALVRTGDTPSHERQAMLRKPPQILVTTPESLYLLLTAEKSRQILRTVETVIVDEIHALARDKRGSHLALSLERLSALCDKRPVRIGLSATQRPMEEIARFLIGANRVESNSNPRCAIIDTGHQRDLDLAIEVPPSELSAVCSNEQWAEVYHRLAELIRQHRSTLLFVNTRRLAERVTHQLSDLLGEEAVSSHHGSLSKKIRLKAEQRLKAGELKAVVATASLELGIDIGFIDLVIQIGSPRSIATFLQRVGRSGHALGLTPKGRLFALTRDELIECAALIRAVRQGRLDRITPPEAPLDILAQQMVAEVAACEEIGETPLFDLCRGAWPYHRLTREKFDQVLQMLSEGFSIRLGRSGAYLHHDRVHQKIRARRGARMTAITSGGAIPELADYRVVTEPEKIVVGSVDEDFAVESMAGDIFLLGNTSWRIAHVRGGDVTVTDAHGAPPTIPFWRGEAPSRTAELSGEVSALREELSHQIDRPEEAVSWLMKEALLDRSGARQMVHYAAAQKAAIGLLPTQRHLLFERFFDESGGMQLVIHAPFGGRINRAWGLALRKRFCRTFDFELQASADDDGIVLSLGPQQSFPLEQVAKMLPAEHGREILVQALLAAPIFTTRWRWNANRALAVLRQRNGKRVPPALQRMRSDDLLTAIFPQQVACRENLPGGDIPIPDHPLVNQTIHDGLHEAMDLDGWINLLRAIERGEIEITVADTREPTPFAYEILNANPYAFLDDAPLEERRARAVATRRTLTIESVRDIGRLDPLAIEQVRKEAWPLVRDADELHDALLLMGMLPASEGTPWRDHFQELVSTGRAVEATNGASRFWVATEQWPMVHAARPDLIPQTTPSIPDGIRQDWAASEGWVALIRGRLEVIGPTTTAQLAADLGLNPDHVESALGALEAEGFVLRGRFIPEANETEWCARRLLARIHRLTLDRLRRQIEPAPVETFLQFLFQWHHLLPKMQLQGREGLFSVIEQLQGFEIPLVAWEQIILPSRIARYDPRWLDELTLNGEIAWGRLRPPASPKNNGEEPGRPQQATRLLSISLMLREDLGWLRPPSQEARQETPFLSGNAKAVVEALARNGASFVPDLLAATRLLPSQLDDALWELVAAGLVTGDGFSSIRSLADPVRREQINRLRRKRKGRTLPRARGSGRWTLFPASRASERGRLHPASQVEGATQAPVIEDRVEAWAWQLLQRYGILFRDLLGREDEAPPWYQLLSVLRRLEQRGEIRGGRFVSDVGGEQYALPEAVEALRHLRQHPPPPEPVFISAVDPLNLIGILTPGRRVTAQPSNAVAFYGGHFAGAREGGVVRLAENLPPEIARKIERTLTSGRLIAPEETLLLEEGEKEQEQMA